MSTHVFKLLHSLKTGFASAIFLKHQQVYLVMKD